MIGITASCRAIPAGTPIAAAIRPTATVELSTIAMVCFGVIPIAL